MLPQDLTGKPAAIGCLPDGTGGNGSDLGDPEPIGDGLHLPNGRQRPLHCRVRQAPGSIQLFAQTDHLPLFVENPVGVIVLDLGHGQPDRIGPDVDGGEARLR